MPGETFLDTFDQQLLLDEVSNWIICWAAEKKRKKNTYNMKENIHTHSLILSSF